MKLWSIGRFDFGLTDEEFWDLTPIEFKALHERWREHQKILDLRSGQIASLVHNAHFKGPPRKPQDFELFRDPELVLTVEQTKAYLDGLTMSFGGTIKRRRALHTNGDN